MVYCNNSSVGKSEYFISSSAASILLLENIIYFIYRLFVHFCLGIHLLSESTVHERSSLWPSLCNTSFQPVTGKFYYLMEDIENCNRQFYLLNIGIAVLLLLICIVSYKYRYRKRDDILICNIYQYAENYYSNYGTINYLLAILR